MEPPGTPPAGREPAAVGSTLRRTTVLTISQRVTGRADRAASEGGRDLPSGLAVAGGSVVLPGLREEERLLLEFVDGRHSVARLARLAGLSEDAALKHLARLIDRRILVPVETAEVTIRGKGADGGFWVGPYEVAAKIGQGGMGSVYVCRRTGSIGFHRLFALKVVRQDSGQEAAAERSFTREVRVGSLLDHPNTQSLIDVGTYKNQPFLVMEYIEGSDLEDASFRQKVPPDILLPVLVDVLHGLQRAHELSDEADKWLGVVHGDVSPPNILIGVDGIARITDFGSARFTALGESGKADPNNLGKPAYMAPEQLLVEPLDARTDVFAVGAVLWTALTGQELFAADSYEDIVENVLRRPIDPPSAHGAPAWLDDICLRALSRDRGQRYVSADDMAIALLEAGVTHKMYASPVAVGAYVRRAMAGADSERRRRIDAALQEMGAPPIFHPPAVKVVPVEPAPPPAAPPGGAADKNPLLARTIIMPGRMRDAEPPKVTVRFRGTQVLYVALGITLAMVAAGVIRTLAHHRASPETPAAQSASP